MAPKLTPQAQRWRTIIFTLPIMGVTSCTCFALCGIGMETHLGLGIVVLYKRLVLGEPRCTLPTDLEKHGHEKVVDIYTSGGEGKSSS